MRRGLVLLLAPVVGLSLAACGDDDGDGDAGPAAFCERAEELEAAEDPDVDLDGLAELAQVAPTAEVRDAIETVVDALRQLAALEEDGDPEEAIGAAFELVFDIDFLEASETLETYLEEECGIEPDVVLATEEDLGTDVELDE